MTVTVDETFVPREALPTDGLLPCQLIGADLWFSDLPAELERAKTHCRACPARRSCLAGAVERGEPCGVWGGEIFHRGEIIPRKRPRGRPRKHSRHPSEQEGARPMNAQEAEQHRRRLERQVRDELHLAEADLAVATQREYAQECALHNARQAARHAPASQRAQADAWCAAAADRLHQTILAVQRARADVRARRAELALVRGMAPAA